MLDVTPLHDRVLVSKLEPKSFSPILSFTGEKQSTTDTMVRMEVHSLGRRTYPECMREDDKDVCVGSVVYVASSALTRMIRSHRDSDSKEYWLLHYSDLDAIEI